MVKACAFSLVVHKFARFSHPALPSVDPIAGGGGRKNKTSISLSVDPILCMDSHEYRRDPWRWLSVANFESARRNVMDSQLHILQFVHWRVSKPLICRARMSGTSNANWPPIG